MYSPREVVEQVQSITSPKEMSRAEAYDFLYDLNARLRQLEDDAFYSMMDEKEDDDE